MAEIDPIRRRKLSHEVLDRLLARITGGQYAAGDTLPSERELMHTFGVGRPAIREALQTLERMGLIAISHGERARVVAPTARSMLDQIGQTAHHVLSTSPQSLHHLKEARLFFELGMVRIAAEQATADDLSRLERRLADHEPARDNFAGFLRTDLAFHGEIARISGNPIYVAVSEAMLEWLTAFHVGLVRLLGAEDLTIAEHRQIVDRVAAHDAEGAAAAMTAHLTRANALYQQIEHANAIRLDGAGAPG